MLSVKLKNSLKRFKPLSALPSIFFRIKLQFSTITNAGIRFTEKIANTSVRLKSRRTLTILSKMTDLFSNEGLKIQIKF